MGGKEILVDKVAMQDVVKAIEAYGHYGGQLGLALATLGGIILVGMFLFFFYVRNNNRQFEKRTEIEEKWRISIMEMQSNLANSLYALASAMKARPCLRNDSTRIFDATQPQKTTETINKNG